MPRNKQLDTTGVVLGIVFVAVMSALLLRSCEQQANAAVPHFRLWSGKDGPAYRRPPVRMRIAEEPLGPPPDIRNSLVKWYDLANNLRGPHRCGCQETILHYTLKDVAEFMNQESFEGGIAR